MKVFTISSKDLLDKRNNPVGRMDVGFAAVVAGAIGKEGDTLSACDTMRSIKKECTQWKSWERELRTLKSINDVEDHIATALGGRESVGSHRAYDQFSPVMQDGISRLARKLCEEEAAIIKAGIEAELTSIENMEKLGGL